MPERDAYTPPVCKMGMPGFLVYECSENGGMKSLVPEDETERAEKYEDRECETLAGIVGWD